MKLCAVLLTLCLVLAACGPQHVTPSALQKFDGLRKVLKRTTDYSVQVARDAAVVNRKMRADNTNGARAAAVALRHAATRLARTAAVARRDVRHLAPASPNHKVTHYFQLASTILAHQEVEGWRLVAVARLIDRDPLQMIPGDSRLLWNLVRTARRQAWQAVQASARANRWRRRYRRAFYYVPARKPAR